VGPRAGLDGGKISPYRDSIPGRKLFYEELYDVYGLPNIIRLMNLRIVRWAGHMACRGGEDRFIQAFFVGEAEGKKTPG
jgi:hypothetical protein